MTNSPIEILKDVLTAMGATYKNLVEDTVAGQTVLRIEVEDGRQLIGSHGDTLHAIDYLVKKIAEKRAGSEERSPLFLVDVNDYRTRQIKDIQAKALIMAERARSFQYDVELTPMSAYERLIVHATLADSPNVKTESHGEGKNRRIVIKYNAEQ
jgi:spoIIIJ-associated protein